MLKLSLKVHPHGIQAMEEAVKRYFTTVCEPQTAYEVTTSIPVKLAELEVALDSLVQDGSLVCKEVGGGGSCCTRLYWHGDAEAASNTSLSTATTPSLAQQPPMYPSSTSTPPGGIRPPTKRSRMAFKSPAQVPRTKFLSATTPSSGSHGAAGGKRQGVEDAEKLADEVVVLRRRLEEVEVEMNTLENNYSEEELQAHIDTLHEYNEVKDMGQLLLGKLAEVEGTTTAALYEQFGLGLED